MAEKLRVTWKIRRAKRLLEEEANEVNQLREDLLRTYTENRNAMGQTKDLLILEERFQAALASVDALHSAVEDYTDRLRRIEKLYRTAQENAILRARMIGK